MAKVTIVLEDKVNEDGQISLTLKPDFHGDEIDENSVAQAYAADFIEAIIEQAKSVNYLGESEPMKGTPDPNKH